ncbi:MAG: lysine--tRNA ligase [Parcubacteria group bacterium]|nr:lysine--tRNA ligase [Parcubacteria group bacterium]
MASLEELRAERIKKLQRLRDNGIDPYPVDSRVDTEITDAILRFDELSSQAQKKVVMGGRVMTLRGQGAILFFNFNDGTGVFQGMLKEDESGKEIFDLFSETVDIGDFVELEGSLFTTKRGEKTILISAWRMLAKSLRPLPDKWHGLQDIEERFRRRYLDVLMSPEARERFIIRSKTQAFLRSFLIREGYLEVETPMLQPLAGGATAEPFKTRHNALDADLYLRIAPELYLKELLVGGFNKVFEMGRNFRNEGIDATHNPEFTMLEFYEAYADAQKQKTFVEELVRTAAKEIIGGYEITYDGHDIDIARPFEKISFFNLLKRDADIAEPESLSRDAYEKKARALDIDVKKTDAREKIMDYIYKKVSKPKLIQPTFITDYPAAFSPFAKRHGTETDLIDRFQLIIGGLEIVNAFSELNDPIEQRARYVEQDKKKKEGEGEVSPSDESYLEAMEYGMPPSSGVGLGVDRLVMLLSNAKNIREVILFPTLRQKT